MKWLLLSLLVPTLVFAADKKKEEPKPDPATVAAGAKLYMEKTCVACHGKDAKTPIMPDYPRLAGQSAAYAEKQMLDIKSGARSNGNTAAMKGVMPLVSEAEIKTLSIYLSSLQ
ncbi:MAG: c-type cytochrome [Myxococcaceae bacterium]